MKNIKRRMTPQPLKIRADVELTCFHYDGIEHIKKAMRAAEATSTEDCQVGGAGSQSSELGGCSGRCRKQAQLCMSLAVTRRWLHCVQDAQHRWPAVHCSAHGYVLQLVQRCPGTCLTLPWALV